MQINMASTEALDLIARDYSGQSKPMSMNARRLMRSRLHGGGRAVRLKQLMGSERPPYISPHLIRNPMCWSI